MKRRRLSEAVKRKISLAQRGKNNSMYGRHHKKSSLLKISMSTRGSRNPMYGKHHTAQAKRKISIAVRRARARIIR